MAGGNKNFVSERVEDGLKVVNTIFGMTEKNFMALMLSLSLLGNIALVVTLILSVMNLNEKRVEEMRAIARDESRIESHRVVEQNVVPKVMEIKDKVDTIAAEAKQVIQKVNDVK